MCPTQPGYNVMDFECAVCLRQLWPGDCDPPFCSPACRLIDAETAVLIEQHIADHSAQADDAK